MNARNMDDLNLKDAFAPMPDPCHDALMNAARSVKEEKDMKRATFRVVLIVAAILAVTIAAALAATQLGLTDFFKNYYNVSLPDSAKTVLSLTEQKTYDLGPLAVTLRETLADGRIVYVTTQAKPANSANALIQATSGSLSDYIPSSEAARLKVPEHTSFLDAAKQANIPLYLVASYLTIDYGYMDGDEMQDTVWAEDGSALLVDMLQTNPGAIPETLTGILTLHVREIDLATGSYAQGKEWRIDEEISIPVKGVTAERTYTPAGEAQLAGVVGRTPEGKELLMGLTVQSIKAEQTCAGIYLTTTLIANGDASREDVWMLYDAVGIRDAQGEPFPMGINLSGSLDDAGWPTVILKEMISAGALPDELQVVLGKDGGSATLK